MQYHFNQDLRPRSPILYLLSLHALAARICLDNSLPVTDTIYSTIHTQHARPFSVRSTPPRHSIISCRNGRVMVLVCHPVPSHPPIKDPAEKHQPRSLSQPTRKWRKKASNAFLTRLLVHSLYTQEGKSNSKGCKRL